MTVMNEAVRKAMVFNNMPYVNGQSIYYPTEYESGPEAYYETVSGSQSQMYASLAKKELENAIRAKVNPNEAVYTIISYVIFVSFLKPNYLLREVIKKYEMINAAIIEMNIYSYEELKQNKNCYLDFITHFKDTNEIIEYFESFNPKLSLSGNNLSLLKQSGSDPLEVSNFIAAKITRGNIWEQKILNGSNPLSYIDRIVASTVVDEYRRNKRNDFNSYISLGSYGDDDDSFEIKDPHDFVLDSETRQELCDLMKLYSHKVDDVIILSFSYLGFTPSAFVNESINDLSVANDVVDNALSIMSKSCHIELDLSNSRILRDLYSITNANEIRKKRKISAEALISWLTSEKCKLIAKIRENPGHTEERNRRR